MTVEIVSFLRIVALMDSFACKNSLKGRREKMRRKIKEDSRENSNEIRTL